MKAYACIGREAASDLDVDWYSLCSPVRPAWWAAIVKRRKAVISCVGVPWSRLRRAVQLQA